MAVAFNSVGAVSSGGTSSTCSIAVPTGLALNTGIIVGIHVESPYQTITPPSGFTEMSNSPIDAVGAANMRLYVYEKRQTSATGAGETTGSYTFTLAGTVGWQYGQAISYTGCATTGSLFDVITGASVVASGGGTTPAVSATTTVANTMLLWFETNFAGNALTAAPSGFTSRETTLNGIAEKAQSAAGATGSITGTTSGGNETFDVWLGALRPPVAIPTNAFFTMF